METRQITPKQKRVLDYIRSFGEANGFVPSQQEIADHFGYRSLGTVQNFLVRLERQGFLKRSWNAKRALEMVEPESERAGWGGAELPMLGSVAAGRPIEPVSSPDLLEVPPSMIRRGENFVLRASGDSMVGDGIMDGDFVVVCKQADAHTGQTVVALVDGEATVKHYYKRSDGIELRSANPLVPTIQVEPEQDFRIEGVVVGVIRHCA